MTPGWLTVLGLLLVPASCLIGWKWGKPVRLRKEATVNTYVEEVLPGPSPHQVIREMLISHAPRITFDIQNPPPEHPLRAGLYLEQRVLMVKDTNSAYHLVSGLHEAGHVVDFSGQFSTFKMILWSKGLAKAIIWFDGFVVSATLLLLYYYTFSHHNDIILTFTLIISALAVVTFTMSLLCTLVVIFQENQAWRIAAKYNEEHCIIPIKDFQKIRQDLFRTYWHPALQIYDLQSFAYNVVKTKISRLVKGR